MIRIENILIKDVRGVRDLTLNLDNQNYVIYGPNGSGKSGIVDAIEFALTGEISRLSGPGTSGLSVLGHGPHVDKRDNPDTSFVELKLDIPKLGKNVKIKRFIKNPKHQVITPDDDDVSNVNYFVRSHCLNSFATEAKLLPHLNVTNMRNRLWVEESVERPK